MMPFLKTSKYFLLLFLLFGFVKAQNKTLIVLPAINDSSFIYESTLSFNQNTFGVILITQKQEEKLRITLTSKFGMKIFDFLLDKDSIHTIYAVEQIDKKFIKKLFYKDFKLIYPFLFNPKKIIEKKDKVVIKLPFKKYKYIYKNGDLIKIKKGLGFTNVKINNENKKNKDLEIIHSVIGLKIKIKPLILPNE